MQCEQCYALSFPIASSYLIPAGLAPDTDYYVWVYKPNSNPFSYQIITDSEGNFIIEASEFPQGFFNQYGGDYQVEVTSDVEGQHIVDMMFSVNVCGCVLLTFLCCE